jgi:hypothetical protein
VTSEASSVRLGFAVFEINHSNEISILSVEPRGYFAVSKLAHVLVFSARQNHILSLSSLSYNLSYSKVFKFRTPLIVSVQRVLSLISYSTRN